MMLNLLKEFVEIYHLNKGLGELEFTSESLYVEKPDLSGQLKEFYHPSDAASHRGRGIRARS